MVASILVMAISFTWDGDQHVGNVHKFLPGILVNVPLLAISFTWDGGQHVGDGRQFYLGWWPACW